MDKKLLAAIQDYIDRGLTFTDFGNGRQVIAAAGTPIRLSDRSISCKGIWLQSLSANTGLIYWGRDSDRARAAFGIELDIGAGIWIPINDVNKIWVDCVVNGEGICWVSLV